MKVPPFSCSTPIFYVNSKPHIGHAYSVVLADAILRWEQLKSGRPAILVTGTDEHGNKILNASRAAGQEPLKFCDDVSLIFKKLTDQITLRPDDTCIFNRTTSADHQHKVASLWKRLAQNGSIYKGTYTGWYSVSDETFYPETRIGEILCPDTKKPIKVSLETRKPVELVSETNYKFRLSEYADKVYDWLAKSEPVYPKLRLNDLHEVFKEGLQDLSVSRSRLSNPWGIQVPDDPDQTIYVWLDALANYFQAEPESPVWRPHLPNIHVIGKDILKFHAIYWPAFLIAADLPLPAKIVAHGHWLVKSTKMSKSLGNVVDPFEEMARFGVDGFRYLLLRLSRLDADADYIDEDLVRTFNNELVNNLGNLVSRLRNPKFFPATRRLEVTKEMINDDPLCKQLPALVESITRSYDEHKFYVGIQEIVSFLFAINAHVNQCKPWDLCKTDPGRLPETLAPIFLSLGVALNLLEPIFVKSSIGHLLLPDVSDLSQLQSKISCASVIDVDAFLRFNPSTPLFPRITQ